MKLQFIGATGTVTGSKYLLTIDGRRLLIDCGLFQGLKPLRLRNWSPLPVDPQECDAVILTHAHLDHSGYLPLFVKQGFTGKVYCTPGTRDLCSILLPDSGYLQEEEAHYANRHHFSKHKPALPLYTQEDAQRSLSSLHAVPFHTPFKPQNGVQVSFIPAGHILGAAMVRVEASGRTIVFSGDLGRPCDPIMHPPEADALRRRIEETYQWPCTVPDYLSEVLLT